MSESHRRIEHTHLRRQHHLLTDRIRRLTEMVTGVERALEEHKMAKAPSPRSVLTPDQQVEVLGKMAFPDEWAEGVVAGSGGAAELAESVRRVGGYTVEDWQQNMDEEQDTYRRLARVKMTAQSQHWPVRDSDWTT